MMRPAHVLCAAVFMLGLISPVSSATAEEAARNYQTFCALCHGPSGRGDGPGATTLPIKPRNFTDCDRMRQVSDAVPRCQCFHYDGIFVAWRRGLRSKPLAVAGYFEFA